MYQTHIEILVRKAIKRIRREDPLPLDLIFKLAAAGINVQQLEDKYAP